MLPCNLSCCSKIQMLLCQLEIPQWMLDAILCACTYLYILPYLYLMLEFKCVTSKQTQRLHVVHITVCLGTIFSSVHRSSSTSQSCSWEAFSHCLPGFTDSLTVPDVGFGRQMWALSVAVSLAGSVELVCLDVFLSLHKDPLPSLKTYFVILLFVFKVSLANGHCCVLCFQCFFKPVKFTVLCL